jgi:O-antigen ligase
MSFPTGVVNEPPKWWGVWLASLAPLFFISPLALVALPFLKRLPRLALWFLGFYAVMQQVPALFSPDPLLASLFAALRTLLMLGLIGTGVALNDRSRLRSFAIGLGIVFATALVYFLFSAHDLATLRLSHPYMTSTSLGLAGALGAWFALFNLSRPIPRVLLGVSSLGVLFFSGSRSALVAAVISSLLALLVENKRVQRLVIVGGLVLGFAVVAFGQHYEIASIQRLTTLDTTDRDVIWSDTFSVIRQAPLSGVGSYLLGRSLAPTSGACKLYPTAEGLVSTCPAWLAHLGSPWLIAHNLMLQQLAETGPLGLAGLLALLCFVVVNCIASREPFSVAVIVGLLLTSAFDNTLLVPSPFFAELFWIVAGMQLARGLTLKPLQIVASLILIPILSLPLIGVAIPPKHFPASLRYLSAPRQVQSPDDYRVAAQFGLPAGHYRVNLRSCTASCATLVTLPFDVGDQPPEVLNLKTVLRQVETQRLELRLFPGTSTLKSVPNTLYSWTVQVKP